MPRSARTPPSPTAAERGPDPIDDLLLQALKKQEEGFAPRPAKTTPPPALPLRPGSPEDWLAAVTGQPAPPRAPVPDDDWALIIAAHNRQRQELYPDTRPAGPTKSVMLPALQVGDLLAGLGHPWNPEAAAAATWGPGPAGTGS